MEWPLEPNFIEMENKTAWITRYPLANSRGYQSTSCACSRKKTGSAAGKKAEADPVTYLLAKLRRTPCADEEVVPLVRQVPSFYLQNALEEEIPSAKRKRPARKRS
jgi:hypothetical protein